MMLDVKKETWYKAGQAFGLEGENNLLNNFIHSSIFIASGCEEEKLNQFSSILTRSNRELDTSLEYSEPMMIMFIAGYLSVVTPKRKN